MASQARPVTVQAEATGKGARRPGGKEGRYQRTVHLPQTDFPMKANLPQREPEMLKAWEEADLYHKLQEKGKAEGRPLFVLHDGPPYANGHIHIGTAFNKILKDIVIRSRSMDGYRAPYVPGWDTHGLPIEVRMEQELGFDRHQLPVVEFRRRCREYALKYVQIQRDEFRRLGVWGDWDNPYLTLKPEYEAAQVRVFGEMVRRGYIYKGLKPVYWCPHCETSLAEAEIEYDDRKSPSIYLRFPILPPGSGRGGVPVLGRDGQAGRADDEKEMSARIPAGWSELYRPGHTFVLVWTTTPWTLPADEAVALHPDLEYVLVEVEDEGEKLEPAERKHRSGERYLLAAGLLSQVARTLGWERWRELGRWRGEELEVLVARRPVNVGAGELSPFILAEHVTLEQGTGVVHTAPGHGLEDYDVGMRYGLPVFAPVDARGHFTQEAGKYQGLELGQANEVIISDLLAEGTLLWRDSIVHQYPHCWRCKNPVVFRATEQWFASVDGFRDAALYAIDQVKWVPEWGKERIRNMVAERHDWCISRQRVWGVPIPVFYCRACGESLVTAESIEAVAQLFAQEGSDAWFAREAEEILPPGTRCPRCGATEFRKEKDIMDVWFDSGSSHAAVLEQHPELRWPADIYLEGSDQHRGWFQSSLLTAVATRGAAPYRAVLTHGFIVDGEGRKMSKSLGNVVYPEEVIKNFGADILRLWVSSADYRGDIRVSPSILAQMAEVYRRIRNTARFILGNLHDFDPRRDAVGREELTELDRFALQQAGKLAERLQRAYREFEFHMVFHGMHDFCAVDMGGFYLDVLKDRLYTDLRDSRRRRAAQTTLYRILQLLAECIAPVLVFTADEIWQALRRLPGATEARVLDGTPAVEESIHLRRWSKPVCDYLTPEEERRWARLLEIRRVVLRAIEAARSSDLIGGSLEALVRIEPLASEAQETLTHFSPEELADLFLVSEVVLGPVRVQAAPAEAMTAAATTTADRTGVVLPLEEDEGVRVLVEKHPGSKCARCWKWGKVGSDPRYPDLCDRCTEAVARMEAEAAE
ncbi:MAG: isoleucine--tRNA ligase [Limnochordales bacterium]|nr:isoleucine--tRNA ligase [Limnochordales bacterium]